MGSNILTLTGSNTNYSGATTVSAGSLQLGDGLSGSDVSLATSGITNNAALLYNVFGSQTVNYTIGGSGSLTKLGSGVLTLSGPNTYSGGTTLSAGQLNINNASALGTGTFTIGGGTIDNTSAGSLTLSTNNAQSWNGNFTYAGSVNNLNLGIGAVTLSGSRQVTVAANTLTVGGSISGTQPDQAGQRRAYAGRIEHLFRRHHPFRGPVEHQQCLGPGHGDFHDRRRDD